MTLPASGTITLDDVNVELGNAPGDNISLGDAAVRGLAGVPSGIISMSDLYGKSAGSVSLPGVTSFDTDAAGAPAPTQIAGFIFKTDGTVETISDSSFAHNWWSAAPTGGIGSSYQVRATLTADASPNGTSSPLNSWITMSSDVRWENTQGAVGSRHSTILVEIRDVATMTLQDSASYDFTALIF